MLSDSVSSNWVVQKMKSLCHVVGLSCERLRIRRWLCLLPLNQVDTRMVLLVLQVPFLSQLTRSTVNERDWPVPSTMTLRKATLLEVKERGGVPFVLYEA
jgi:hypothetical protein